MEKSNQKKLVQKISEAAAKINLKGDLSAGYIWAPYVPLYLPATMSQSKKIMFVKEWLEYKKNLEELSIHGLELTEVSKFKPNPLIASRYALKNINPGFYGVINVENLNKK